jgi:hypothetical protein
MSKRVIYKSFRFPRNKGGGTLIAVSVDNVGVRYYDSLRRAIFVAGRLKSKGLSPVIMPNANPKKVMG